MKRLLLAVAASLFAANLALATGAAPPACVNSDGAAAQSPGPVCQELNAQTTTGAGVWVYTALYSEPSVRIWGADGSTNTVLVECTSYWNDPPWPCYTTSNVTTTGVYYTLPRAFRYRVNVTANASATPISSNFETYK